MEVLILVERIGHLVFVSSLFHYVLSSFFDFVLVSPMCLIFLSHFMSSHVP